MKLYSAIYKVLGTFRVGCLLPNKTVQSSSLDGGDLNNWYSSLEPSES